MADREREEITVIEEFLPRQLSAAESAATVDATVAKVGADRIRDMDKVMAILKGTYTGQMDSGSVGPLVKDRLCS